MASKSFGGSVKLTGESEYQKALRGITDNLKVLNSEMKVVTSQYDKNDNSQSKLKATSEVLNKKIGEQESKVSVLKKALADAEKETGKNSDTTKKWQNELNLAEAELNDLNKELKDQHSNLDESGKKASILGDVIKGNLISQGVIAGIKALGSAIKSAGSAFINVGKQAVQSYAQYEQLVGGVDTLFGESSAKVQEYASNAFKTSGMSANQYMETVTSFSASLIQSLDGDTAKASEVANRAIIDMSDNANKMGTDISSIQMAYQGFAKGQFQLLDNLKLGYGGTKGEMERLIADASKMTDVQKELGITVAEGDMSFANIANAISVVQKNMGLMGTTAQEASGTISGSTGSMKSAWQNLVTGIADDNADFDTLVNNLVESIVGKDGEGGFLTNMLPRIETAMNGVVTMVISLADSLLPQLLPIATNLLTSVVGSVNELMPVLLNTLISTIVEYLPTLVEMGCNLIVSLAQGLGEMMPTLIPQIISALLLMVETLLDNVDLIVDAGIMLIIGLADGLIEALPDLIDKIPVIISKLTTALTNNAPKLIQSGVQLVIQLVGGLVKAIPNLISAGAQLLEGIFQGLLDPSAIWNAVVGLYNGIVGGIKSIFGIHSPSTKMRDIVGKNLALGVSEGFVDTMGAVTADMAGAIPTSFDTSINASTASSYGSNYDYMVSAFKQALKDVKVVMNNREMGAFVTETMERAVFS